MSEATPPFEIPSSDAHPESTSSLSHLAFLVGFAMVVVHVPGWSQPAMEPKSALLLAIGGLAWGWVAWSERSCARFPRALLFPLAWLALTMCWSPSPGLGALRIIWFLAAAGVVATLIRYKTPFMLGFLLGCLAHASLIFLQWVPTIRALLPPSLGVDPFQGVGRGFFHNTNMAAQPLLFLAAWLLWGSKPSRPGSQGHLFWVLPALALTQSRLAIGVCAALLAYTFAQRTRKAELLKIKLVWISGIGLAFFWSYLAHSWGWLLPACGAATAFVSPFRFVIPEPPRWSTSALVYSGLSIALLTAIPTLPTHSRKNQISSQSALQSSASLEQRKSYYHAAALAFLDSPVIGQGFGSARALYPVYVDHERPVLESAYGDFTRPNNLHSEPIEWVMEGGLLVLFALGIGVFLDRKHNGCASNLELLIPLAGLSLLDFPLHYPLGILWLALHTAKPGPAMHSPPLTLALSRWTAATLALGLALMAFLQIKVAIKRPEVEAKFLSRMNPQETHLEAVAIWKAFPFSADLLDLRSKTTIQAAALLPGPWVPGELDELLQIDPNDHHLLLARAQYARAHGDAKTARLMLARYAQIAPADPARYFRLAKDAILSGKSEAVPMLIEAARKQPGFGPQDAIVAEQMLAATKSDKKP